MLGTDKYAYASKIKNVDPTQKFIASFAPMLICLFVDKWQVSFFTLLIMILINIKLGGNKLKNILNMLYIPMGFLFVGTITIIINRFHSAEGLILSINIGKYYYGVSSQSIMFGLNIILKSLAVMACVYFFVMNTTMSDFSISMLKMKVPKFFVEIMELIYRFIFILGDSAERIKIAQNSRLGYKDLKTSYKSTGDLAARVFINSMRRSDKIYNALESRGYQGEILTLPIEYKRDDNILGAGIIVCGIQILVLILLRFI